MSQRQLSKRDTTPSIVNGIPLDASMLDDIPVVATSPRYPTNVPPPYINISPRVPAKPQPQQRTTAEPQKIHSSNKTYQQIIDDGDISISQVMPDYSSMTETQKIRERTKFRLNFDDLKANNANKWTFSEIDIDNTELPHLWNMYDVYRQKLKVRHSCKQNEVYLILLFVVYHIVINKVFGIDSKFLHSQLRNIRMYDSLITELGEKYNTRFGTSVGVEWRILLVMTVNAVIVILMAKYLPEGFFSDSSKDQIMNMVGGFFTGDENNRLSNVIQSIVGENQNGNDDFRLGPFNLSEMGRRFVGNNTAAAPSTGSGGGPPFAE